MNLSPDQIIYWQLGWFTLNATLVFTWLVMAFLVFGSMLITRNLAQNSPRSRWQNMLEVVVITMSKQIEEVGLSEPHKYLPFLGSLFLFIAVSALCSMIPGFEPATGSLSTTAALALCVFVAVPIFGIGKQGLGHYLASYAKPTFLMLPFNIISEISRTLALAIRLFGNMMSGAMIIAILLSITPFLFPILLTVLGLLTGIVQAYIFFILATVYIAAATRPANPSQNMQSTTPDDMPLAATSTNNNSTQHSTHKST
ncbi:F0F1 ATP synthase subunit A [Alishewanella sp. SMS9]|uniref:F0F1 ATP synthase subunit A n=1 Tax=Pseudoalteromonas tunicata TaxID=314281 RepID=UPI00273F4A5E|nr:F0F1 ATP synthase subunit A [Pseudoalteromonas tunicata]MDP5205517.1 F0F1 ATP synthase subunit A [Alishewanella sp. SMS9]MDP5215308.1 F0F1 ATP synthase subunit A [Pseudoalteromonas tunicata]